MYTPAEIAEDVETSFIPASEQTEAVRAAIIAAIEADRAQRPDPAHVREAYDDWSEAAEGGSADDEHDRAVDLADEVRVYMEKAHPAVWLA